MPAFAEQADFIEVIAMLIVKSKVKDLCSEINLGGDFIAALNTKVDALVKDAIRRAKENGRRTVLGRDV